MLSAYPFGRRLDYFGTRDGGVGAAHLSTEARVYFDASFAGADLAGLRECRTRNVESGLLNHMHFGRCLRVSRARITAKKSSERIQESRRHTTGTICFDRRTHGGSKTAETSSDGAEIWWLKRLLRGS